ncbi:c-type cytochrome [Calothrix sp. UHCC 0171]|uniref:c-type cytochrome n=1 Tax=Calothrix sp. UHCC 0171 TaxID=3110245 RepID=UPI002B1F4127|nr:c-type cytochrome [Calothrix sp. UHCC 0171]MEA5573245.1 c-type cytochrome [Calothrix sp. UHCC 0171]
MGRKRGKQITLLLLLLLCLLMTINQPVYASESSKNEVVAAKIFEINCAGCHLNGSNIIRRGKNLKINTLKKYQMDLIAAITEIVTNGKNNMSAYKDKLTAVEIQDVAKYVLQQAENNWK